MLLKKEYSKNKTLKNKRFPFVSIIIPARNEEKLINNCLKSLKKLNYPQNRFEIIISDGLSADKTVQISKRYQAKVVRNKKQTVGPGRNIGFRHSKGELVAFSDADCVMDKNWLNNALKYFKQGDVAGIGGPNLVPVGESPFGRAVRFLFLFGSFISGSVQVADSSKVKIVKSIPGSNAIYKREPLKKIMPVNEELLTCDDTELNYQLRKKEYKLLYVPDVIVWHYRRDNPKKLFTQIYRYAIGRVQLSKIHKNSLNTIHVLAGLFLPIFIFLMIIASFLNHLYPLLLIFLILISFIIFAFFGLIKERSFPVALNIFLASLIFLVAWSLGFLRELVTPLKKSVGRRFPFFFY
jgi:cellulose synthase/poly-beta-1,6-N-acetylglucosamine synthase-like glycosyltransferase